MKIVLEYVGSAEDGGHTRREPISVKNLLWVSFEWDGAVITVKPADDARGLEMNCSTGRLRVHPASSNLILVDSVGFGDG